MRNYIHAQELLINSICNKQTFFDGLNLFKLFCRGSPVNVLVKIDKNWTGLYKELTFKSNY